MGFGVLFPGVKLAERDDDHSPLTPRLRMNGTIAVLLLCALWNGQGELLSFRCVMTFTRH
jgi:hypothetical protein